MVIATPSGIDALTYTDAGTLVVPETSADWDGWVAATATRNHILGEPLLDWLDRYGRGRGYTRDHEVPGYDPRTDFARFIQAQAQRFEQAITTHLGTLEALERVGGERGAARDLALAERTVALMQAGTPIIAQGVLRDPEQRAHGVPDLLLRSDMLARLFPGAISVADAEQHAPGLGTRWHYRVIDVKFTTLHLNRDGDLGNGGSASAYKAQLHAYNAALGRVQGFEPPYAYLLGRGWQQQRGGDNVRGATSLERLALVPQHGTLARGRRIDAAVAEARAWVRRLRAEGDAWDVAPVPTIPELHPNLANDRDGPWHRAKRAIAARLEDPGLLWHVGTAGRHAAIAAGVHRWSDPRLTPALVGLSGRQAHVLDAVLRVNREADGPPVLPAHVTAAEDEWRAVPPVEFYVDFETVSDLQDDFTRTPERGGQPLIAMIGCGHVEGGVWTFECFIADRLTEHAEGQIIERWLAHMDAVRARLDPGGEPPPVLHWSPAEVSTFESAYNAAVRRHADAHWPHVHWFDVHRHVVQAEPVVVRGALAFGLKEIARALHAHGLIKTVWGDGPADGLGAMVGMWWCEQEAAQRGCTLAEVDLMQEVARYNEVDCRTMMEIVHYLRAHH